jgi:hypothetical protein
MWEHAWMEADGTESGSREVPSFFLLARLFYEVDPIWIISTSPSEY